MMEESEFVYCSGLGRHEPGEEPLTQRTQRGPLKAPPQRATEGKSGFTQSIAEVPIGALPQGSAEEDDNPLTEAGKLLRVGIKINFSSRSAGAYCRFRRNPSPRGEVW